jgi:Fe-Mn family superoxide dismutase
MVAMAQEFSIDRRDALASLGVLGVGAVLGLGATSRAQAPAEVLTLPGWDAQTRKFVLPPLPYAADALEPHIDAQTMEIHHIKHHQGYVNGLNKALDQIAAIQAGTGDTALIKHWAREASFHGSGHVNHTLFWSMMAPAGAGGGGEPAGALRAAIERDFGTIEKFRSLFSDAANQVEGGGWAWLVRESISGRLIVIQGEKQQDLMITGAAPILGIDVWEHAYYLKHQNRRGDYVKAWWNVVNWGFAGRLFEAASA